MDMSYPRTLSRALHLTLQFNYPYQLSSLYNLSLGTDDMLTIKGHSTIKLVLTVRYHSRGSMKLNACNLLLAHMVYL
jgi:hypothetical protein